MHQPASRLSIAALVALALVAGSAGPALLAQPGRDEVVSTAISVGRGEATLELEFTTGRSRTISLRAGSLLMDGREVGRYAASGSLEREWRRLLSETASLEPAAALSRLRSWAPTAVTGDDAAAVRQITAVFSSLAAPQRGVQASPLLAAAAAQARSRSETAQTRDPGIRLADLEVLDNLGHQLERLGLSPGLLEAVRSAPLRLGHFAVPAGERVDGSVIAFKGDVEVRGEVTGHVVALFGDVRVHEGAIVRQDALAVDGELTAAPGTVLGASRAISAAELAEAAEARPQQPARPVRELSPFDRVFRDVRNVIALFVALAMLGFGAVFFGRRHVEVVADTVSHSFSRALVVGVLGQLLLLPTLAMLVVGLVFTLVGILVLPFAVLAYVIAAFLAVVGGYLAVAHAIGETFTRRRMAHGAFVRAPNAYGYLFTGLVGLLGLWALSALTGWMGPIAVMFHVAAAIVTWVAATAGFGAVLLSRAGLRESFTGRHFGDQTDEYLWATPPATPTASRMKMDR